MIKIDFPEPAFKTSTENGIRKIFDQFRKQWVVLTPEEWVRQNILIYLSKVMKYPAPLFAIEKEIRVGELKKRCDIVVYNTEMKPWMIVECKEMGVKLDGGVVDQILRYHSSMPCEYLMITNGSYTFGFKKEDEVFKEIESLPAFNS